MSESIHPHQPGIGGIGEARNKSVTRRQRGASGVEARNVLSPSTLERVTEVRSKGSKKLPYVLQSRAHAEEPQPILGGSLARCARGTGTRGVHACTCTSRHHAAPRNARIGHARSSSTGPLTLWLPANSRTHAQVSSGRRELAGVAKAMMPEAVLPRRPPARDLGVRARVGS